MGLITKNRGQMKAISTTGLIATSEGFYIGCLEAFAIAFARCTAMPGTAIVAIYTPEGFAIAADGRDMELRDEGGSMRLVVTKNDAQKIFCTQGSPGTLACALTGHARFKNDTTGAEYDFDAEIKRAGERLLSPGAEIGFTGFVEGLCQTVNRALGEAKRKKVIDKFPDDAKMTGFIAGVVLVGYYDGLPSAAMVMFLHRNQALTKPQTQTLHPVREYFAFPYGTPNVWETLCEGRDSPLKVYRSVGFEKLKRGEHFTLAEAVDMAEKYILACSDTRGEVYCETVGGHVHVATITQSDGFRWVIPPKG